MMEGPMERENQRIKLTKRMLKESMLRLLEKKELDKISVTELCRDAGINRATFYRHYEIPRDVLLEIEKDFYYEIRREIVITGDRPELKDTVRQLCECLQRHRELLRIIIRSNTESDFSVFINTMYREFWSELRQQGLLSELSDEDTYLLTLYSAGGSYFLLRHWLMGNIQKDAKQMADYVYELLTKTDWDKLIDRLRP